MDSKKLANHVKLCKKNLKSNRVKCCANCPFEEEIVGEYPEVKQLFKAKRKQQLQAGIACNNLCC